MAINQKTKISLTIFITAIIVAAIFFLYFKYLPKVINLEKHRPQIEEAIKENINLPVTLGKLHTSVTWNLGVRIDLDSLNIRHSDKSKFISTGTASIEVSIPAFLKKQVLIREIDINYPVANITRFKNGIFDIEQLIPPKNKPVKYKVVFKNSKIIINEYQIYFNDKYMSPAQFITITGKNIQISEFNPDKFINVYANGQVLAKSKPNTKFDIHIYTHLPLKKRNLLNKTFGINGTVQNIYPGAYLTYINKYIDNKFIDLSGFANLKFDINRPDSNNDIFNFKIEGFANELQGRKKSKGKVISIPEQLKIILDGSIDNSKKQILNLNNAEFTSPNANVNLTGKIYNFKTKNKNLDLKLKVANSRIESIVELFPKEIRVPKDPFNKLYKYNAKGNATADITLKGYYRNPQMYGNVKYNDFSIDENRTNVPKGSGQVDFDGYYLKLNTFTYINPNEHVKVTGIINPLKDKTIDLNIVSNNLEIERAQKVLLIVRDILNFKLGPVPLMHLKGRGDVTLTIKGPTKAPNLDGFINVKNGYATYELLAKFGHDINGKLLFKDDRFIYNKITGYVEDSKVIAEGYSTMRLDSFSDVKLTLPKVNLKAGHEFVFNSPLLIKVKESLINMESANGSADAVIYLKGTNQKLYSNGIFILNGAEVQYNGFNEPFKNLNGIVKYNDEMTFLENIKGIVAQSPVIANGTIDKNQNIKLILTSNNANLAEGRKFIKNSPILFETENALQYYQSFSGTSKAELSLTGYIPGKKIFDYIKFKDFKASFFNKKFGYPVNVSGNQVLFTMDAMYTNNMKGSALDTPFVASGKITGFIAKTPHPNMNINIPKLELSKVILLSKSELVQNKVKSYLNKFDNLKGSFGANINLLPHGYIANIKINDIQAQYLPWNTPLYLNEGRITVSPETLLFSNVYAKTAKSSVYLNGSFNNYLTKPGMDLIASAKINSDDINDYLNPHLKNPLTAKGIIPVSAIIKGNPDHWKIISQLVLNKGSNIAYLNDLQLPDNKTRIFNLNATGGKNRIVINNLDIAVDDALPNKNMPNEYLLNIKGSINNLESEYPYFDKLSVVAPNPIDITLFNTAIKTKNSDPFFSEGKIKGNILLNGKTSSPQILGNLSLYNVNIPSQQIIIDNSDINLNQDDITINNGNINIGGSPVKINAVLANVLDYPLLVKNITIDSPSLNIDRMSNLFSKNTSEKEDLPQFVVTTGIMNAQELIISNLITNNVTSNFTFTPDWLLSVNNMSLNAAGGTATGEILYNIKSTDISANITVKNMQANAAATTMLKLPNEVYGILNGKGVFNSKGRNSQEIIANANGFASFKIADGRLVRLGSLEYFLRAYNIVQSGIAGFNLNNILDLIVPQNTGNFQALEGTLITKDGVLKTDNLSSKGKNLSLFLSGDIDMVTNNANVTILGNMSKKVSGLLGPIGSVSINTFIDFIPGIGFLPSTPDTGLINLIPGISRIPGLGLGGSKKVRRFAVKIDGNLYDPKSVKSFRWLD
ncbi:MAG: AsmA-like C-terminal region-containing protein [Candidatus Gastranaerophilales bacterium]|nr:AsmA-like C-terminal region-containing protein [Candidatus Gastranaerophilales bacterium]